MSQARLNDFRQGVDRRKFTLEADAGTLYGLNNGHITAAGQVQKRKALKRTAGLTNTFGLQELESSALVFGSQDLAASFPITSGGRSIGYQRLQHPDGATNMTSIVHSSRYEGKVLAIAKFTNETFAYYDGTLIADLTSGFIISYFSTAVAGNNNRIAAHLSALINSTGFVSSSSSTNTVEASMPLGVTGLVSSTSSTAAGVISTVLTTSAVAPVAGAKSQAAFEVSAGSYSAGTNKITSVKVGTQECLVGPGTAVDWTTSNEVTVGLLVTAINAYTATSGFTATQVGASVVLYSSTSVATHNNKAVSITTAGNVCIGFGVFRLVSSPAAPITAVTSVTASGLELLAGAVAIGAGTIAAMCTAVATSINTNTATHGYLACAIGDDVYVSKALTSSSDAPVALLIVTTGGGVTPGNQTGAGLEAIVSPSVYNTATDTTDGVSGTTTRKLVSSAASAVVTGGTIPYTYFWELVSITQPSASRQFVVTARTPTLYSTDFQMFYETEPVNWNDYTLQLSRGVVVTSTWVYKVTDVEGANIASNVVTVSLYRL